jgi:hypothetical protein
VAILIIMFVVVLLTVGAAVRTWHNDRPPRWSTPYERLLERNPMLNADASLRWTVRARRVRTSWFAALVVAVAVLIASDRPRATAVVDER